MASSAAEIGVHGTPKSDNKTDVYWQVGKSVGECLVEIYEAERWTDISFRCMDHVTDDPEDRLRAHKLILAARSPVFSAMFYGPNSEDKTEIVLHEYSKESMDIFLRFQYNDFSQMDIHNAEEVFKIAHFYQVSVLLESCCGVISQGLTNENACHFLEMSMLYDQKSLKEIILAFIDNNVEAVLKSQGFLQLSRDTLEYLLTGDTLFTEELTIVKAVHEWASPKLAAVNKQVTGVNIRELLGDAFYFLRMTTMTSADYIKIEKRFCYHDLEECKDIVSCMIRRKPKAVNTHATNPRHAKTERKALLDIVTLKPALKAFSVPSRGVFGAPATHAPVISSGSPTSNEQIHFACKEDVTIIEVEIDVPVLIIQCLQSNHHEINTPLPLSINVQCPQTSFKQTNSKTLASGTASLSLDPPLVLDGSPDRYTLALDISCPTYPWVSLNKKNPHILKSVTFTRFSHRDRTYDRNATLEDEDQVENEDEEDIFTPTVAIGRAISKDNFKFL